MKKIRFLFSLALAASLVFACTSDNSTDKYAGGGGTSVDNPVGKLAHFLLDGTLENSEDTECRLFLYGKEVYAEGAGVNATKALVLDGRTNYLAIPIEEHDTLSVVFWAKMSNGAFWRRNAEPVWLDYGAGAVSFSLQSGVMNPDGSSEATKLLILDNTSEEPSGYLLPGGADWNNICTWENRVFFYAEITSDYIKSRIKTKYEDGSNFKDYNITIDKSDSPLDTKPEWLYIGKTSGMSDATGKYLEGIIDDIHIYNRGLTAEEIEAFAQVSIE